MGFVYEVQMLWCDEDNEWFWAVEMATTNWLKAYRCWRILQKAYPDEAYRLVRRTPLGG